MIKRSELRHACFRAKNGVATEQNMQLLKLVEPLLQPSQRWENFSQEWDLFVSGDTIKIVKPETDVDFIRNTCLEKHFQTVHKTTVNWDDRKLNVLTIVELLMLDRLMTWENYNTAWGVEVDFTLKQIRTKLFTAPSQLEVTSQMIKDSVKSDGAAMVEIPSLPQTVVDAVPLDPSSQTKAMIEAMLSK